MSSSKLDQLARRRETLIIRSDGQRERLAESCEQLSRSLKWANLAKGLLQQIKDHPAALLAPATFMVGPGKFRRVGKIISAGWSIFQAVRGRRRR
jgi:hypothetical protein